MARIPFILITILCCSVAFSQNQYAVSKIPKPLLEKINVVKRLDDQHFEIMSTKETILRKKWALTIFNDAGSNLAGVSEMYDQLHKIISIEGTLFDEDGNVIRKMKPKEVHDEAVESGSFMEDNRIKRFDFFHKNYPYTVEYEVAVKYNHTLFLPSWVPQNSEHMSVESSSFTVVTPPDISYRFKAFNYSWDPQKSVVNGKNVTTWRVSDLPAIKRPYASPPWREITPTVLLAPDAFEVQGYKGVMKSWNELGLFQLSLNKDRDQLPEVIRQKVVEITSGLKTDEEKIEALYNYLQQNTRYISIQLGIGGWQPFEASFIANKGYGDCKGLSNYMYSLLKAAGIRSYYSTIRAGQSYDDMVMLEDFPSRQSNHVVLCVPLQRDTMWLECTSQSDPAGYMGSFTGNRKALVVTENGGELVATPRYRMNDNLQIRKIKGTLSPEGDLIADVQTHYRGLQQDDMAMMLSNVSKTRLKEILTGELDLPDYELDHFEYKQIKARIPSIEEKLMLRVRSYATVTGKRLFITPNLLNKSSQRLTNEERKFDICFSNEIKDVDSVEINIPEGWEVESMPQPVLLKTKFGTYSAQYSFKNNQLVYVRTREYFAGRFSASDYTTLVNYANDIYKADRNKIVLVKKEGAAVAEKKTF